MIRIVAEDDEIRTCDCGAKAVIVRFMYGKTFRECLTCGTQYNAAFNEMSLDEMLDAIVERRS